MSLKHTHRSTTRIHLSGGVSMKRRRKRGEKEREEKKGKKEEKKGGGEKKGQGKKDAPPGIEPRTFPMVGHSSNH